MTGTSELDQALEEVAADLQDQGINATKEDVKKNVVIAFVLRAPRAAKRAASKTVDGVNGLTRGVNAGILKLLPLLGFMIMVSFTSMLIMTTMALTTYAVTAAFSLNPFVGWTIVLGIALLVINKAAGLVSKTWGVFFGNDAVAA